MILKVGLAIAGGCCLVALYLTVTILYEHYFGRGTNKWFKNRPVFPPVKSKVELLHVYELTLVQWQEDPTRVDWARTNQMFAEALSVVRNLHPAGYPLRGQSVTDIQAAIELGRKEGYSDAVGVLMALRQFPLLPPTEIEADYDDTDYRDKTVDTVT